MPESKKVKISIQMSKYLEFVKNELNKISNPPIPQIIN